MRCELRRAVCVLGRWQKVGRRPTNLRCPLSLQSPPQHTESYNLVKTLPEERDPRPPMAPPSGLQVRPATFSDYWGVMDINRNVHDGYDYLPAYYHLYIQSTDVHCFVGEVKGKIVGFAAFRELDGGQTLLSVAGRVKMDLNRQGLYYLLAYRSVNLVQQSVPSVAAVRHAGLSGRHFEDIPKMRRKGTAIERVLMKSKFLAFSGSTYKLRSRHLPPDPGHPQTTVLPPDRAAAIFDDITNLVCLYPSGYLLSHQNARPQRATVATIREVLRSHYAVFSFREKSSHKLSAFSLSHCCHTPKGLRFDVYYYDVTPDAALVTSHVIRHLGRLRAVVPSDGEYRILLHVPFFWDLKMLRRALGGVVTGVGGQEVDFPSQIMVVGEGPANPPHIAVVPSRL